MGRNDTMESWGGEVMGYGFSNCLEWMDGRIPPRSFLFYHIFRASKFAAVMFFLSSKMERKCSVGDRFARNDTTFVVLYIDIVYAIV